MKYKCLYLKLKLVIIARLESLLCQPGFLNPLLHESNYNCDYTDNSDDGDNDRALDQLNTFMFYGITGINRIL